MSEITIPGHARARGSRNRETVEFRVGLKMSQRARKRLVKWGGLLGGMALVLVGLHVLVVNEVVEMLETLLPTEETVEAQAEEGREAVAEAKERFIERWVEKRKWMHETGGGDEFLTPQEQREMAERRWNDESVLDIVVRGLERSNRPLKEINPTTPDEVGGALGNGSE